MSNFVVRTEKFEGPLDLLYSLIEKRKLQINTISLAEIADEFIGRVKNTEISIEETAQFVYTASILILIKSRTLLPMLEYTQEEETDMETLESRLQIYGFIHSKAVPFFDAWKKTLFLPYFRKEKQQIKFIKEVTPSFQMIHSLALNIVEDISFLKMPEKKIENIVSLEEMIEKVLVSIREKLRFHFKELTNKMNKEDAVISFLAILELFKKNMLSVTQQVAFDDIVIEKIEKTNMDNVLLKQKIEAVLLVSAAPIKISNLEKMLNVKRDVIDPLIKEIEEKLCDSGFTLINDGISIALSTHPAVSDFLQQQKRKDEETPLSKAAQETLSIIGYTSPITKTNLDFLRGVNTQFILRRLQMRGLIQEIQKGNTRMISPTIEFLQHMNITIVNELPEYESIRESILNGLEAVKKRMGVEEK